MFFFQAEDGIRDLVRSRGLGDVYKRQDLTTFNDGQQDVTLDGWVIRHLPPDIVPPELRGAPGTTLNDLAYSLLRDRRTCLLYTSDAADERSSVDLGGRRIIKKKKIAVDGTSQTKQTRNN